MRKIVIIVTVIFSFMGYSQETVKPIKNQKPLLVSDIMTTHLIFKEKLKYLDIGSQFFVADTLESIVKIKHTGQGLDVSEKSKKSNLTIITQKGTYYSIPLYYAPNVEYTTYRIEDISENVLGLQNTRDKDQKRVFELGKLCDELDYAQSNISLSNERDMLRIKITGLFYKKNYMAVRMELRNNATIDFDIDKILLRFKIDKKMKADYIYQERVLNPVMVCNETTTIKSGKSEKIVMIFDKFTPNDDEKLYVDIFERNGGRSTTITIPRKKLLTPKTVALN